MPFKIKHICILICATVTLSVTAAQPSDLLRRIQMHDLLVQKDRMEEFTGNPAQMVFRDSVSLSTLGAKYDVLRLQKPVMEQTGDGHTLFSVSADTYTRLSPVSALWGNATFTTGKYDNIRWSDCIDYERIAPYVLGDEAGGDLSTRRYTFGGGYSKKLGRWTAGIDASYRAEIAWRNHDPRIKTIVSDLDVRFGGARVFGAGSLGLSLALNIYNQNCDLDFYSPVNEINTYTLTGLGTYYNRFMGNTNKNSGYTSVGYTASVQWLPLREKGISAEASYMAYRMNQQLRSFNNITLGYTDNNRVSARLSWQSGCASRILLRPTVRVTYFDRKGTENLFGTSTGGSYDKIGSRSPYRHSVFNAGIDMPMQIGFGGSFFTVNPYLRYYRSLEKYTEPQRKLEARHIVPGMMIGFSARPSDKWQWMAQFDAFYASASSQEPILVGLDTSGSLGRCVVGNFEMLRADQLGSGLSASVSRLFKGSAMTLSASYRYIDYKKQGDGHALCVSLSAGF